MRKVKSASRGNGCEEKLVFLMGKVVRLKAGGPPMTVTASAYGTGDYECTWFVGKELKQHVFWSEALVGNKKAITS